MTMIDNDIVGLFALLSSAYVAGVFIYVNDLLNTEARAAAAKRAAPKHIPLSPASTPGRLLYKETFSSITKAPEKCCRSTKKGHLDA